MIELSPKEQEPSINPDQLIIEGLERVNDTLPVDFKYEDLDESILEQELSKLAIRSTEQ